MIYTKQVSNLQANKQTFKSACRILTKDALRCGRDHIKIYRHGNVEVMEVSTLAIRPYPHVHPKYIQYYNHYVHKTKKILL